MKRQRLAAVVNVGMTLSEVAEVSAVPEESIVDYGNGYLFYLKQAEVLELNIEDVASPKEGKVGKPKAKKKAIPKVEAPVEEAPDEE